MTQSKKPTKKPAAQPKVTATAAGAPTMKNVTPAADATAAFLREVDAAMHQEQMQKIWDTYKWVLFAAVVLAVAAVGAKEAWQAWNVRKANKLADQWYAYSELKTDVQRAQALPELLSTSSGGTHALAVYSQAAMQHTGAEKAKAYAQVVNSDAPEWLKDMARLNSAIVLLDEKPEEAKAQLELLAQGRVDEAQSPVYAPALELLSLLAEKSGDAAAAKAYAKKILELEGMPADMRQRALQRFGALGGQQ